jgi:hypothetical protein
VWDGASESLVTGSFDKVLATQAGPRLHGTKELPWVVPLDPKASTP